jgi:hypothetical protein
MEHLVCQIRAPLLGRMDITLFNQIALRLPHLTHFLSITEQITFPKTAEVSFSQEAISLSRHGMKRSLFILNVPFTLRVMCKPLDWQIDCTAQICGTLMPAPSGLEKLNLTHSMISGKLDLQLYEVDYTTWHDLLRLFTGVKELCIDHILPEEISHALEMDEIGLDPGFLPDLQELDIVYWGAHSDNLFRSFIHARRVAGRPVSLRLPPPGPASGGLFGTPTTAPSLFGPPQPGSSPASSKLLGPPPPPRGGLFDSDPPTSSLFGRRPLAISGLFSPPSSFFGSPPPGNLFGPLPPGGLFSPPPPGGLFGSYPPASGGLFGPPPRPSSGLFGPRSPRSD